MATISGRVIFDRDRSAAFSSGDSGLANIPIVLQDIVTTARLTVLTDANGNYSFINVPNGDYRIVESYGTLGGVPTPGNFTAAAAGSIPQGVNPPISSAANPPPGSTNLDSVTPDTLLVTVSGADLINRDFFNGPVIYTPVQTLLDPCAAITGGNLIDAADNGTFGTFPQGTPANTGAPVEPYPGVTPDFTYVLPNPDTYTPAGGEYTVQNIMNDALSEVIGAWWRIADHTAGNETGRMMVVNGFNPGAVFFRDVVTVTPNTNYLFTAWILNLFKVTGYPNPELGVRILDQNNNILYDATLGVLIPPNPNAPEWKQIGSVINSQGNTSLTVEFLSEGPEVIGNDYAIDDIALNEIMVPEFIPVKTVSAPVVNVGETVEYTVTLTNTCENPLTEVFFRDAVPDGLSFVPGSVTINSIPDSTVNPDIGFLLPNVPGGGTVTVRFEARADFIPSPNPTLNSADVTYSYTPVEGGIPLIFRPGTNEVPVEIVAAEADMAVVKTASPTPVLPGGILTYTITVSNLGPDAAENVVLSDAVPAAILNPQYSVNGGVFLPWAGSLNLGAFADGEVQIIRIRGTVSPGVSGPFSNTAVVSSTTPDPNPENNTSTVEVAIGEAADLAVVKTASPSQITPGGELTYTIAVSNLGPDAAENAVLTDAVPSALTGAEFFVDGGTAFLPWPGFLALGTLAPGETRTILIRGTINPGVSGALTNTAEVTSTTPDPNPDNNTSTVVTPIRGPREQAVSDLIESVALEEAGLAHILNAEGEKLQRIIADPCVTTNLLLQTNKSVRSMTDAITMLEMILSSKIGLFEDCLCPDTSSAD